MQPLRLGAALSLLSVAIGCQPRARPWDQGDAEAPPPPPSHRPSGLVLAAEPSSLGSAAGGSDGGPDGSSAAGEAKEPEPPTPPVRVGGPWVRCYGNFRPSGDPVKDVTRLSLLCGPENGMRRLSRRPLEGAVAEGGPSVTELLEARRGECYRVFAVAEPTVVDLDITVQSSRGAAIAADHSEDCWPIVQPDRPFCPLADDRATVEITARRGRGRFAAEVWVLRSPKASGEPGKAPGESAAEGAGPLAPVDRIPSGE